MISKLRSSQWSLRVTISDVRYFRYYCSLLLFCRHSIETSRTHISETSTLLVVAQPVAGAQLHQQIGELIHLPVLQYLKGVRLKRQQE